MDNRNFAIQARRRPLAQGLAISLAWLALAGGAGAQQVDRNAEGVVVHPAKRRRRGRAPAGGG